MFSTSRFVTHVSRVQIKVSGFEKYDKFFIFNNTVFSTCPENHDTKI